VDEAATVIHIRSEVDATRSVAEASRQCREAGLGAVDSQAVATAVSELVRNILKYAGSGEILFRKAESGPARGVIVTARDRGPGIEDIEAAMCDHFSSSGTLGLGLPGVKRMMDEFAISSEPGVCTTVSCLKWNDPPRNAMPNQTLKKLGINSGVHAAADCQANAALKIECAVHTRPCTGERVSGDIGMIETRDHLTMLAVFDGLGHGPEANKVACQARDFLRHHWCEDVIGTMQALHEEMRGSIGGVAGLAVINTLSGNVRYTGVGNTVYRLFGSRNTRLISTAGNLGQQIRSPQLQQHALTEEDVVLLYSDGIKDRFELEDYPQLRYQGAETIARTVVERFGKHHDDATCVAVRGHR